MKDFTIKTLAIFLTIFTFTPMVQSESDPFKLKPKSSKIIQFTPDDAFGGVQAQGKYKKRGKTATIINGQKSYSFDSITENLNPSLTHNKLNLVTIGFFSNKTNRSNMPVTTYIFGLPANDATTEVVQAINLYSNQHNN